MNLNTPEEINNKQIQNQEKIQQELQKKLIEEQQKLAKLKVLKYLTEEAKNRLDNIIFANPALGYKILNYILYLGESGYIKRKITDQELKEIAKKMIGEKRDFKIRRV